MSSNHWNTGMRLRPLLLLLALVLGSVAFAPDAARAAGPSCTVNQGGGADYTSIQAAVDDTSCTTISVAAGTYTEHVTVARDVTISGVGASSTIVDGTHSGTVFTITRSTVTLQNLTIANGLCNYCNGGGLSNDGGTVNINNSTFSQNSAVCDSDCSTYGGGIVNRGTLTVSNSTFAGNSANFGGGIVNSGTLTVSNSTFAGNSASAGGGIEIEGGTVTVNNSTFAGNSASNGGAGIFNFGDRFMSSVTVRNTIIANSTSGTNCRGLITDGGGNISYPDQSCPAMNADPQLDPNGLQNNGGPTQTIALLVDSPAIDAIPSANCVVATDQRGVERPQGHGCDIGAFELEQQTDTTAPTITISSPGDGALYQRGQAVAASYACQDEQGGSDVASCTGTVASGANIDTASVGSHTFTVNAADTAGNTASNSVTYQVVYNWAGFFQPIDNLPTLNSVKAGSAIPVKFSLGGNYGLNIFASGYPKVQQVACANGAPVDEIEQTVAAGASGLQYDATTGQYSYTWKTDKKWAGSCRQLVVRLVDGTEHVASFTFK